jgi:hypothetical protein
MKYESMKTIAVVATGIFSSALALGCSRDHIEAINLANLGDKSMQVNVEGAIQKYEEATRLDPTNHQIFNKLGKAYQKKEDWDKMASTMARAQEIAPDFAGYSYKRGYALMQKAQAGNPDARRSTRTTRSVTTSSAPRTCGPTTSRRRSRTGPRRSSTIPRSRTSILRSPRPSSA